MALDYTAARINMVENQVRTNDVTDLPIQDAMRVVPRERFCPPGRGYMAYAEAGVEYAPGWFLMQPRDVAKLLQAIFPHPGERALAIAAPYAAAVLARMGLQVTLALPEGEAARAAQTALEGDEIAMLTGDLSDPRVIDPGGAAPYDVIVCEGAVSRVPDAWIAAMAVGGRLGVVERSGPMGKARLYVRGGDALPAWREVFDSGAPILPGFEAQARFAL